jgi:putative tryptophan/tyrosine transport system substrate-binding protein
VSHWRVRAAAIFMSAAGATTAMFAAQCIWAVEPSQKVVRVGFVSPYSPSTATRSLGAFWARLRELGYVEGRNLVIEARWADGRNDRLPVLIGEVLGRNVDVLVTWTTPAATAAKNATSIVPIVVAAMGDPVAIGLVATLAHPGGNLTGLSMGFAEGMGGKWLELLQETVPRLSQVAVIENPDNPANRAQTKELEAVARSLAVRLQLIPARDLEAFDRAFAQAHREAQAVLVLADPLTVHRRDRITALAAKYRIPGMYPLLDFVDAGGLMAYSANQRVLFRRAAEYVDKILKGANPGDLPIEQPTQFELAVNLKTARALGLTIPESILLRADEVIR